MRALEVVQKDGRWVEPEKDLGEAKGDRLQPLNSVIQICPYCGGAGCTYDQVPTYGLVTKDMASDACDPSLEGCTIQTGFEDVQEPCQMCNGTGEV